MTRIAYVDHSYHRRTRSTAFLPDILERHGHRVDFFWDEAWQGGAPVEWAAIQDYDIVIMFQSFCTPPAKYFRQVHPNVIYIPMLDQFGFWSKANINLSAFWEPFQGSKVLNFSKTLHHVVLSFGIYSHSIRYFQPPVENIKVEGLHGFFWLRNDHYISWKTIRTLIGGAQFDSFHIHMAPDPGSPNPSHPSLDEITQHNVTTSTWFDDKSKLDRIIDKANIYFAPRPGEGIGQSFLEAMSRGKCVVSPDQGTMNEYIVHGVNGLLYDLNTPRAIDFSRTSELGWMAQQTVRDGYEQWKQAEEELVAFIIKPSENFYFGSYQHPNPNSQPEEACLSTIKSKNLLKKWNRVRKTVRKWFCEN